MSTIATKKNKSKKPASKKSATIKAKDAFRDVYVAGVAENLRDLVRILSKGLTMLPVADDVPEYLADATVIIGDAMINLSVIDEELGKKCEPAVVTPYIDVSKVVDVEMDVHGYLHGARRELDTLLFLTDNALGLETLWDVSTPDARRAVADSARQAFIDALRQIQVAENTLESFRKELQRGDTKKNGGA